MLFLVPSVVATVSRPDTAYPTWEFWHDSVCTTGLMHPDQRHPGWNVKRPRENPWRRTTSTRVLSGVRTSSACWWDLTSNFVTVTGFDMSDLRRSPACRRFVETVV